MGQDRRATNLIFARSYTAAKRAIASLVLVLWIVANPCVAAILDPTISTPESALLRSIAPSLDRKGIDTVLGNALQFGSPIKPRIAPLKGYYATNKDWNTILPSSWALAFKSGMFGVLVAIKPSKLTEKKADCDLTDNADVDPCTFVQNWLNCEPDQRVFIAFTSADVRRAELAKEALEQNGYVVFMFLKSGSSAPWADPALVGEVFAQASHRFVLDTASARGSDGVALEAKLCEFLLTPPPPLSRWAKMIKGTT
jgi:hypothetical protein